MAGLLAWGLFGTVRTYLWEEIPCTIVESHRVERGVEKSGSDEKFVIRYRYLAKGSERISSRLSKGITESYDESTIERLLLDHPVNGVTRCYVNPANPEEAILRRGPLWVGAFIFIPLIFVAVGVGGIIRVWTAKEPAAESIARKARSAGGKMAGTLCGVVFALVGAGILYGFTIHPALRVLAARSWEELPCQILRSEVGKSRGSKGGTTYSVDITYTYQVKGRDHRSDRYRFIGGSSSGYDGKLAVVNQYPRGATKTCFVNPGDPTDAVLNRGFQPIMLMGLLGLLFLVIGLCFLAASLRSKTATATAIPGIPSLPASNLTAAALAPTLGPLELESASSPMGRVIGSFFLAAFWNGITGVFVVMAIKSWLRGKPEILLSIFMIPFVVIGLGAVLFFFHSLLNLLNPRIRLTVGSGAIPLGGKLDARWAFRGLSGRIRHLQITMEGSEKAEYRRGTTTSTDTRVFARIPLVDTTDSRQIFEGQSQLSIPADLMHTFTARHNEIIWKIKVHGDVPRFPDVDDEFKITILPRA